MKLNWHEEWRMWRTVLLVFALAMVLAFLAALWLHGHFEGRTIVVGTIVAAVLISPVVVYSLRWLIDRGW